MTPRSSRVTGSSSDGVTSTIAEAQARMRAELAVPSRLLHVLLLLTSTAMAVVLAALLLTEPTLPPRTRLAFFVMLGIAVSWMVFFTWVLRVRRVLLAEHRVLAARMAVLFTLLFTLGAVVVAPWSRNRAGSIAVVGMGAFMIGFAVLRFVQSRRDQHALTRRRAELESQLRNSVHTVALLLLLAPGFGVPEQTRNSHQERRGAAAPGTLGAQQPVGAEVSSPFVVRGQRVDVYNGTLPVATSRSSTTGNIERLALAYVRVPSTKNVPSAPSVFLAGGPGDAATRALQGMPHELLDALRGIADVVAFDQRGTGRSEPHNVLCPPGASLPLSEPGNPEARIDTLLSRLQRCLADSSRARLHMSGLTTLDSAHDLEELRQMLGVPKLSLLAGSYGTHLALAYAREYPEAVQRMVLAGVEGPDHTLKLPARVQHVLTEIAAAKRPSLLTDLETLLARVRAAPVQHIAPGGQSIVLGAWDLQRYVADALDAVPKIDAMVASIPELLAGNFTTLAQWAARDRAPRPLNLMNLAMDCASLASAGRLQQIRSEAKHTILGDVINFPLPEVCERASLVALPDTFRSSVSSRVPALLMAGEFDARTPVSNAHDVAATMPAGAIMVVRGASHGLFLPQRLRLLRWPVGPSSQLVHD